MREIKNSEKIFLFNEPLKKQTQRCSISFYIEEIRRLSAREIKCFFYVQHIYVLMFIKVRILNRVYINPRFEF